MNQVRRLLHGFSVSVVLAWLLGFSPIASAIPAPPVTLDSSMTVQVDLNYPTPPSQPYLFAEFSTDGPDEFSPGESFRFSLYDGNDNLFARTTFLGCGSCSYIQAYSDNNGFSNYGALTTNAFHLVVDDIVGSFSARRINLIWYDYMDIGGGVLYPDWGHGVAFGIDSPQFQIETHAIPEPKAIALVGLGLFVLFGRRRIGRDRPGFVDTYA